MQPTVWSQLVWRADSGAAKVSDHFRPKTAAKKSDDPKGFATTKAVTFFNERDCRNGQIRNEYNRRREYRQKRSEVRIRNAFVPRFYPFREGRHKLFSHPTGVLVRTEYGLEKQPPSPLLGAAEGTPPG